jgi:hypothetical protein
MLQRRRGEDCAQQEFASGAPALTQRGASVRTKRLSEAAVALTVQRFPGLNACQ